MNTSPSSLAQPLRVLLVEDTLGMQEVVGALLRKIPRLVLTGIVDTAADAIERFVQERPEVVILDLGLREGNGLDVLRKIRQTKSTCRVIVFTSHDSTPYRTRCLDEGADHFFSKDTEFVSFARLLSQLAAEPLRSAEESSRMERPVDLFTGEQNQPATTMPATLSKLP